MNRVFCIALVALGAALGTWAFGWWAVPMVALIAGLARCGPGLVSLGSATGWAILLVIDAIGGNIGRVASILGGVMGLPAPALFVLTLALPALLGWSAASLGDAALSLRAISRQPS